MPLPVWVLPVVGTVAGLGTTVATIEIVRAKREGKLQGKPSRMPKDDDDPADAAVIIPKKADLAGVTIKTIPAEPAETPEPAIKTFGEDGAWKPRYLKSLGCQDFRWGVCLPDLIESIQTDPQTPEWTKNIDEVVIAVANVVSVGSGEVAQWLLDRACLRFKFPLRAYEDDEGHRLWKVAGGEAPIQLTGWAPEHPYPPRTGYKRVWVNDFEGGAAPSTRNETAVMVFWPASEEGGPALAELISTSEIRSMLRLAGDVTGAINAKKLAAAGCGKSKWWFARRSKAMPEFR